jgi:DNA-binding response OmpR family regulator
MSGAELAERIRGRWPTVHIVVVSGNADESSRVRLGRIGVEIVQKPFTKDVLGAAISAALH